MIKLRHRTDCEKVILFILLIIFIEGTVSILIPEIHPIYYLVDVLNIILVIVMIASKKIAFLYRTGLKNFMVCMLFFCGFSLLSIVVNFSNFTLHIWGIRGIMANLFFFMACVTFEHSDDLGFIEKLFWINLFVSVIEIILGYRQDWFGGIYGIVQGNVNGPLNLLLIIIMTKSIIDYINKNIPLNYVLFKGVASIVIASFAEIKIFYVEICVLVILCSLVTRFTYKKLAIVILSIAGALIGIKMLYYIFPEIDVSMFSLKNMWRYITNPGGYVGQFAHDAGDINRLSFWNKCIRLLNDTFEKLFGLGIGNCDRIELIGVESTFYHQYSALHYYMFSLPMILLQQGIVGMILYILLFVFIFIAVVKKKRSLVQGQDVTLYQIVEVLCLMSFLIIIYDTSLMGKGGYLFFYILALPFINSKSKISTKEKV